MKRLYLNENNENIIRTNNAFKNGGILTAVDKDAVDEVLNRDDLVLKMNKELLDISKSTIPENPGRGKKIELKPYTERKNMSSHRKYLSEDTNSLYQELLSFLKYKGFDTSNNDVKQYASAAAEYISLSRDYGDWYSIEDWYKDTKQNYPEELADLKKLYEAVDDHLLDANIHFKSKNESYRRQHKTKKMNEGWEDLDSYRDALYDIMEEASESEIKELAQDLIYWCSEDEIKRFMELRDYDLLYEDEDEDEDIE